MTAQIVPDFLCIGAQRSGTSWLYSHLRGYPGIWLPVLKELHYFDAVDPTVNEPSRRFRAHFISRAKRYVAAACLAPYWTNVRWDEIEIYPRWDYTYFTGSATDAWYASLFADAKKAGSIVGEITPAYAMLSVDMIRRVRAVNPRMKIIFLMRDPIERSWSQATKDLCKKDRQLMSGIPESQIIEFLRSDDCVRRSDYNTTMENWLSVFDPEQVLVGFLDDIKTRPVEFMREIVGFLGLEFVDNGLGAGLDQPKNPSKGHKECMPRGVELELARLYEPMLSKLRQRYGAKPGRWHDRALSLLAEASPQPEVFSMPKV